MPIITSVPAIISDWCALIAAGLLALGLGGQVRATACELIYEVDPHAEAQQLVGAEMFARLATLSWDERQGLARRQSVQANNVLRVSEALDKAIDIAGIQIIQGGYEGKTNPAITVRLSIDSAQPPAPEEFMAQASRLAATFGYIYYQDSVLVLCPAAEKSGGDNVVRKHVVTDSGGQPFLSPETARYLYGMMMGRHGVVDNTGYSYDPESRQFMVLDFNEPGFEPDKLLREIAAFLQTLSAGRVKLKLETSTVLVDFPHNSWAGNPRGQAYLKTLPADANRARMGNIRAAYLQALSGSQPAARDQPRKAAP